MQLEAQLLATEFDLKNTVVRAPARGIVPRVILRPGMQVSSSRAVLTFVDIDALVIAAQVQQKAIENIQLGDTAMVNFPAFPGRVYEAKVIGLPRAIGDAQALATGQLPVMQHYQMTRLYPLYISIPEELPGELQNIGFAAKVYIHTEGAGAVGIVATVLQWVGASLDLVM